MVLHVLAGLWQGFGKGCANPAPQVLHHFNLGIFRSVRIFGVLGSNVLGVRAKTGV